MPLKDPLTGWTPGAFIQNWKKCSPLTVKRRFHLNISYFLVISVWAVWWIMVKIWNNKTGITHNRENSHKMKSGYFIRRNVPKYLSIHYIRETKSNSSQYYSIVGSTQTVLSECHVYDELVWPWIWWDIRDLTISVTGEFAVTNMDTTEVKEPYLWSRSI